MERKRGKQPTRAGGGRPAIPRDLAQELRDTARGARLDEATSTVAEALQAHLEEDFPRARRLAERAKDMAPRSAGVRELLGLTLYKEERWHEALRELMAYRRMTGNKDQNHIIADCYRAGGKIERALEIAGEVSRGDVTEEVWTELVIVTASAVADGGNLDKAIGVLNRADLKPRKVQPHHLRLFYVRADLLERAGRNDEARTVWESIAAEDPGFFDVSERLARPAR